MGSVSKSIAVVKLEIVLSAAKVNKAIKHAEQETNQNQHTEVGIPKSVYQSRYGCFGTVEA